jgi:hypothetical protein
MSRERVLEEIKKAIETIHYGSVEIVIHDSKVVQIERKEKLRLDNRADRNTGSSHQGGVR